MENETDLDFLISYLLKEMPQYVSYANSFKKDLSGKMKLFRSLMNLMKPKELSKEFLEVQDFYLKNELESIGLVDCKFLPLSDYHKIALWRGDIIRLKCDAIVNVGNNDMLGCFVPNHNCLDNQIHSYAGLELRNECNSLMASRGHKIALGDVLVTKAYNLQSRYVFHVLGVSVRGRINFQDKADLKKIYLSIMKMATSMNLKTIAIPCISAGEQGFPKRDAALIATETIKDFILEHDDSPAVIFDVYTDLDEKYYRELLHESF